LLLLLSPLESHPQGKTAMDWVYQNFGDKNWNYSNHKFTQQAAVCKRNLIQRNSTSPLDTAKLVEKHNNQSEWWKDFWGYYYGGVGIASITPDGRGRISLLPTNWTYYDFMYGYKGLGHIGVRPEVGNNLWPHRMETGPTQRILAAQFFHFQAESNERVRVDFGYKPNTNLDCDYALTVWDGPSPPDLLKNDVKYCFYTHGILGTKSPFNTSSETNDLAECIPFGTSPGDSVLLRTGRSGNNATRDTCPFLSAQSDHSAYTTPPMLVPELPMNDTNGTWIVNRTGTDVPIPGTQWVLNGCKQHWTPACASGTCTDAFTKCTIHAWEAAKVSGFSN
jgi:hypothetical protein